MGGGRNSCIYLTYFKDFDLQSKSDTPIKGPRTTYQQGLSFSKTTISCMGVRVPALHGTYPHSLVLRLSGQIDIPPAAAFISSEAFINFTNPGNNGGGSTYLGGTDKVFGIDAGGWWGTGYIGGLAGTSNVQAFNGATVATDQGGSKYVKLPFNLYGQLRHIALTCNYETSEVRHFIDGDLYAKYTLNAGISRSVLIYAAPNSGWSFDLTQAAIFTIDKSTNGGMNYPVPTAPYDPSVVVTSFSPPL